jgi:hypothetical protein
MFEVCMGFRSWYFRRDGLSVVTSCRWESLGALDQSLEYTEWGNGSVMSLQSLALSDSDYVSADSVGRQAKSWYQTVFLFLTRWLQTPRHLHLLPAQISCLRGGGVGLVRWSAKCATRIAILGPCFPMANLLTSYIMMKKLSLLGFCTFYSRYNFLRWGYLSNYNLIRNSIV